MESAYLKHFDRTSAMMDEAAKKFRKGLKLDADRIATEKGRQAMYDSLNRQLRAALRYWVPRGADQGRKFAEDVRRIWTESKHRS